MEGAAMTTAMYQDLLRQHHKFERTGYDGHRRHSGLITMHRLAMRRARRVWRQRLTIWAFSAAE
jgi:hypothetical protein